MTQAGIKPTSLEYVVSHRGAPTLSVYLELGPGLVL